MKTLRTNILPFIATIIVGAFITLVALYVINTPISHLHLN